MVDTISVLVSSVIALVSGFWTYRHVQKHVDTINFRKRITERMESVVDSLIKVESDTTLNQMTEQMASAANNQVPDTNSKPGQVGESVDGKERTGA